LFFLLSGGQLCAAESGRLYELQFLQVGLHPQDPAARVQRRYKKRWTIERSLAWLGNFRRLVVRYDRSLTMYEAFVHIACFMITLRRVLK
jgi:transposase